MQVSQDQPFELSYVSVHGYDAASFSTFTPHTEKTSPFDLDSALAYLRVVYPEFAANYALFWRRIDTECAGVVPLALFADAVEGESKAAEQAARIDVCHFVCFVFSVYDSCL